MQSKTVKIETDYIELFKLLKYANIVESGAVAKIFIEDGVVFLNGSQEFRKRAKIKPGDRVLVDGQLELTVVKA